MRVLHLLASPFFTGPADAVTQLALAQRALGHEVHVAVDRKRRQHSSEELAVPRLEPLGLLSPLALELSVKSSPLAMLRDVLALRGAAVDVVHCHFSHDHALARLARPRGAALVRSIHAPRSVRWAMPDADGWTAPTEAIGRLLLGRCVLLLPPLVEPAFTPAADRAALRRELGLPDAAKLIGMVSTFQPSRRHALGLEAFAALLAAEPATRLVLVGDGGLEGALRAQAAPLGEAVRFTGYQQGPAFVRHLQALDEVWVLGLGNDWGARAAAQARACGVRVVAVDEGALARFADALVEPTVASLLEGSRASSRRLVTLEAPEAIARRVLEFYERVRA